MKQTQRRQEASHLAGVHDELYHSTPYAEGFPYDDWTHVGTRIAAAHRAAQIRPTDYGFPADHPVTMHTVRLRGRVYPHILTNEQADEVWGAGHTHGLADDGLPDAEGYHIFPYGDDAEDGNLSYLVHRSAIIPVHQETIQRNELQAPHGTDATPDPQQAIDEEDLDSVRRAGYATEDYERWQFGKCATYARALMKMRPGLKFGAMGVGSVEHKYPTHYFAHDSRYAYDSAGLHLLPYHGITYHADYSDLDQDPHGPGVPPDACEQDIVDAQDHARRNGILAGRHQRHRDEAGRRLRALAPTPGEEAEAYSPALHAGLDFPAAPVTSPPAGSARPAAPLVIARGLWYRMHRSDQLDLDPGRARSRPLDHRGPGQAGLSAFASPHHLLHYATEVSWGSRGETPYLPEDRGVPRRVVAFHGREIGRGDDDEPLVRPEPGSSCCGRIVHGQMAWSTFRAQTERHTEAKHQMDARAGSGERAAPGIRCARPPIGLAAAGFREGQHRRATRSEEAALTRLPELREVPATDQAIRAGATGRAGA